MSPRKLLVLVLAGLMACSTKAPTGDGDFDDDDEDGNGSSKNDGGDGNGNGSIGTPVSSSPDAGSSTPSSDAGAATTCQSPRVLGSIAGDVTGPSLTVKGTCSEWLQVRVTEEASAGDPMRLRVTLVPDATIDFDLYVYLGAATDQVECSTTSAESALAGTATETASLEWGESGIPNGTDDDRTVSIEVRAKDPTACAGSNGLSNWTLLVEGDASP